MDEWKELLKGVNLPLELVASELSTKSLKPSEVASVSIDQTTLFYCKMGEYVPADGKYERLLDGKGIMGFYLKTMDLFHAKMRMMSLLMSPGQREKLYTKIDIVLKDGTKLNPIYVFTEVVDWK